MADWPYNGPWPRIRKAILQRDNHTCQTCGRHATTVNHIQEASTHPHLAWDPANLQAECQTCNYGRPSRRRYNLPPPQRQW